MDASASSKVDAAVKDVYAFFLKIDNNNFPAPTKQKRTVIKYTKLPEFDYETKGPQNNCMSQPRLRRIITLEEPRINTTRSLKMMDPLTQSNTTSNISRRKIITISEDDEYDLHPKFTNHSKKSSTEIINKAETEPRKNTAKKISQKNKSQLATSAKYSKNIISSTKLNKACDSREEISRSMYESKLSNQASLENIRSRPVIKKEITRKTKSDSLPRTSLSKNYIRPRKSELETSLTEAKLNASSNGTLSKKYAKKPSSVNLPVTATGSTIYIGMKKKRKLTPVIHVPVEKKCHKHKVITTPIATDTDKPTIMVYTKPDGTVDTEIVLHQDMSTGTDPPPKTVDEATDMESSNPDITYKYIKSTDLQADLIKDTFEKLDIPNVSLRKDKINYKEELLDLHSQSLPNLQIPPLHITNNRRGKSVLDTLYGKSSSYIFKRSTLTYETKQEINVHVVDNNYKAYSNRLPSQLKYPMSVVSVFKEELSSNDGKGVTFENNLDSNSSKNYKNCVNEIKSHNCTYIPNSNKLMKPSDIISTIRVNNGKLESVLVCEQFQRELNFIDSFFESLQYLESCSLSEKRYKDDKIEQIVKDSVILDPELDPKNSPYNKYFSKLENGANSKDSQTMASKNLILLNILIRDEQRRAKNLLCVLKRREDALKDFTKSHILYLENKKKQENTDISALKKKQRGALLKLQHECGEMQRMRKALVALSEKRKLALMKTKRDLELKLKNNVTVTQMIAGKRKLRKSSFADRTSLPLKCFDLSSSGCEESSTSQDTSNSSATAPAVTTPASTSPVATPPVPTAAPTSVEKSIQTSDSISGLNPMECSTNTVDEDFIVVDGSYLNILFDNLTLPQIFRGYKQYEVNEEALKTIVDSTNTRHTENWSDVVEKLMNQRKNEEQDKSSTPSTARSLVEEFEQYYKTMTEEDQSPETVSGSRSPTKVYEESKATSSCTIQVENSELIVCVETITAKAVKDVKMTENESCQCEPCEEAATSLPSLTGPLLAPVGNLPSPAAEPPPALAGPLPVPPGEATLPEPVSLDHMCLTPKPPDASYAESSSNNRPPCEEASPPLLALDSTPETTLEPALEPVLEPVLEPSLAEAEELRRQQLAIEREIKELEQQQCRLLVVREIPDKPPPPYTPPVEARPPQKPRPFRPDAVTEDNIRSYVTDPTTANYDPADAFDVLVRDFTEETIAKYKAEPSDKPWDACNLLPQKPALNIEKLIEIASDDLIETLTAATPSLVSGVSSKRSDHIDDVLFAEWRRAEPEWTSLHSDEASVKNQLFDNIFQKILTDTVDEYKRTVLDSPPMNSLVL